MAEITWHGRKRLGDIVWLGVRVTDGTLQVANPNRAPYAEIYSSTALVRSVKMPIVEPLTKTGIFAYPLRLGSSFSAGSYNVIYRYTVSSTERVEHGRFSVIAGGDDDGSIISMTTFVPNLERNTVIFQTDQGLVGGYRQPTVE